VGYEIQIIHIVTKSKKEKCGRNSLIVAISDQRIMLGKEFS